MCKVMVKRHALTYIILTSSAFLAVFLSTYRCHIIFQTETHMHAQTSCAAKDVYVAHACVVNKLNAEGGSASRVSPLSPGQRRRRSSTAARKRRQGARRRRVPRRRLRRAVSTAREPPVLDVQPRRRAVAVAARPLPRGRAGARRSAARRRRQVPHPTQVSEFTSSSELAYL